MSHSANEPPLLIKGEKQAPSQLKSALSSSPYTMTSHPLQSFREGRFSAAPMQRDGKKPAHDREAEMASGLRFNTWRTTDGKTCWWTKRSWYSEMLAVNVYGCLEVISTKKLEAQKWIEKLKLAHSTRFGLLRRRSNEHKRWSPQEKKKRHAILTSVNSPHPCRRCSVHTHTHTHSGWVDALCLPRSSPLTSKQVTLSSQL